MTHAEQVLSCFWRPELNASPVKPPCLLNTHKTRPPGDEVQHANTRQPSEAKTLPLMNAYKRGI
jgi:hypothetical protein